MKLFLTLFSLLMLSVACSTNKGDFEDRRAEAQEEYREEVQEAEEDYKEEVGEAREDLNETQKEEAIDYVEESEKAEAVRDEEKVDVTE